MDYLSNFEFKTTESVVLSGFAKTEKNKTIKIYATKNILFFIDSKILDSKRDAKEKTAQIDLIAFELS